MSSLSNKIAGVVFAALVMSITISAGTSNASAQWRRDDRGNRNREYRRDRDRRDDRYRRDGRYDDRYRRGNRTGYGYNTYEVARREGYQQGLYTGSNDARRGQSYNPQRSRYYKNADSGYNSSYGPRGQYRQAFRDGFLRGYREGYQRYGGYNNRRGNRGWFPW